MVACSIPQFLQLARRGHTQSVTSGGGEGNPLLDILLLKVLFFLVIKVKDIEKLLKRTTQVSENGWTIWFPLVRYVCFFRVQERTARYLKKHFSVHIFQTLEKQEVDRVEFTKKQIMLYVFLRKEVNEICEKVTVLKFVAFLNSYCSSHMKAIIHLYRELNF